MLSLQYEKGKVCIRANGGPPGRSLSQFLQQFIFFHCVCISQCNIFHTFTLAPGGVGHDSQSVPGEIFAGACFHLIAGRQTSLLTEGDVEII